MVVTFPLSYPISKSLDFVLGQELGTMFTRDALKELVNIQSKKGYFSNDEMKMLSGALDFKKKTASDIMTPIDRVFMISVKPPPPPSLIFREGEELSVTLFDLV